MSKKILVIDDERPTLKMFGLFLNVYGYEMLTAENGEEGIEIFKMHKPPIVLTDIKMPGMDGIEVLRRIKKIDPSTEVIVITGHGDMDLAIEALNLDATDFLNKPIQRHALEQALQRANERIDINQSKKDEISLEDHASYAVINLQGNITSLSEPFLQETYKQALELNRGKLILHFSENASINGAGIAILTQLLLDSEKQGVPVSISGLSENFRKVFSLVGMTNLVTIYDTIEEAAQA
jgi:anti-anti-sigma factor